MKIHAKSASCVINPDDKPTEALYFMHMEVRPRSWKEELLLRVLKKRNIDEYRSEYTKV